MAVALCMLPSKAVQLHLSQPHEEQGGVHRQPHQCPPPETTNAVKEDPTRAEHVEEELDEDVI
jgi:hypothetical protein